MQVSIISFTDRGQQLAESLADRLCGTASRCGKDCSLGQWVRNAFDSADALIYVGAVGICVRTIAPYIKSKTHDPAVVVIDETGRYVIPVLSGHLGGANDLARRIARLTGAEPVITTATDLAHAFSVDAWARMQAWGTGRVLTILTYAAIWMSTKRELYARKKTQTLPPGKPMILLCTAA